jgi:hypothetical protein
MVKAQRYRSATRIAEAKRGQTAMGGGADCGRNQGADPGDEQNRD